MSDKSLKLTHVLKLEWGGSTGTKYYGDTDRTIDSLTIDGRVTRWGDAVSALDAPSTWSVTLADDDGAIRTALRTEGPGQHPATLYLVVWDDTAGDWCASSDWVVIWGGVTEPRATWRERDAEVSLSCVDFSYSLLSSTTFAKVVTLDDFPYARPDDVGVSLPTVYGMARSVDAVCVKGGGPVTVTTTAADIDDTTFYVADATADVFANSNAGSPIRVWWGRELVEGYFSDNYFVVTNRAISFHSGNLTFDSGKYNQMTLDTTDPSGYWEGFTIRLNIGGSYQYRTIQAYTYSGGTATAWVTWPFTDSDTPAETDAHMVYFNGNLWRQDAVKAYDIITARVPHKRGEPVRYAGPASSTPEIVYILSDSPATTVYGLSARLDDGRLELLPSGTYTLNTDDDQFDTELGGHCVTATFRMPPEYLRWGTTRIDVPGYESAWEPWMGRARIGVSREPYATFDKSNQRRATSAIVARIGGPEEDGALIEHPLRVMRHMAVRAGLDPTKIDEASIDRAVAERPDYRCAFDLREGSRVQELLEQLARACGCWLDWTQGRLHVAVLTNDIDAASYGTADMTLPATGHYLDSMERSFPGIDHVATRMRVTYRDVLGVQRELVLEDSTSQSSDGVFEEQMDFWCYAAAEPCKAAASFWLYRKRYAPEEVTVETPLDYITVLPGDVVDVGGDRGWVKQVTYHAGDTRSGPVLRYVFAVPPSRWYDAGWSYDDPSYTDPADVTSTEETAETPAEPINSGFDDLFQAAVQNNPTYFLSDDTPESIGTAGDKGIEGLASRWDHVHDIESVSSDPGTPTEKQLWYNTTSNRYKYYTGSETITLEPGIKIVASDPGSPSEGDVWYNTTDHVLRYYDGTDTIDVGKFV